MSMFSIDAKLEQELISSVSSSPPTPLSKNSFFQMFYRPNQQQNLIDKTDMDINVSYLPNFRRRSYSTSKAKNKKKGKF